MQANINSIAIVVLGLASLKLYDVVLGLKIDSGLKEANSVSHQRFTINSVLILKEAVRKLDVDMETLKVKVDKYLDIENPFNLTAGGDEI